MSSLFEQRLNTLQQQSTSVLAGLNHGLEREGLRITPQGRLAQTAHGPRLGSALTHPLITTDYSEALLEFITPVYQDVAEMLAALQRTQQYVYSQIEDELIWNASMPCVLGDEADIPIARYGESNSGRMKYVYRVGLAHRYGKLMQTIAGVHYNFSFPSEFWPSYQALCKDQGELQTFISDQYFALLRNFQRWGWLIPYLFGASPSLCKCFVEGRQHQLQPLGEDSVYLPYATSLRMSDLGYQSDAQSGLRICYNSLEAYVATLEQAIRTPYPDYEALGVQVDGVYRQLNPNILQIENEYYSAIRPKRSVRTSMRPTRALQTYGVEYIEVRSVDINPYLPLGVDESQLLFLDVFLSYCLLQPSAALNDEALVTLRNNHNAVVLNGRDPALQLVDDQGQSRKLTDWLQALLTDMQPVAELLAAANPESDYLGALAQQQAKLADPQTLPSARILADMQANDESFFALTMRLSQQHKQAALATALSPREQAEFAHLAETSLQRQQQIEADDSLSFEDYIAHYFA